MSQTELALYDSQGKATAYIGGDGETIYTWTGHAAAYLVGDEVHSWRGRQLGWFERGIMYDKSGGRVGYLQSTCPVVCSVEPVKSVKTVEPVKSVRNIASAKPVLSLGQSDLSLSQFLTEGA